MNWKRILISAAMIILILRPAVYAQNSRVVYFMKLQQNHLLNPAIKPANLYYMGLPVVSGIYAGMGNNFIALEDIFVTGIRAENIFTFENPDFNLNTLTANLKDKNTISSEGSMQVLGLGLPVGKNYTIFLDINDRLTAKAVFPKELMNLYILGGTDIINKPIDISGIKLTGQLYREYGLGFSGNVIKNLRIGAKFKLLSGLASLTFDNEQFSLKVNSDFSQTVTTDASLRISGQETMGKIFSDTTESGARTKFGSSFRNYLFQPIINSGLAVDIGAVYNLGKMFTLSFSITDLGYINWTNDLKSYSSNNTFTLPGITLEDVVDQSFSIDDMIGALKDSLKVNFPADDSPASFRTNLPATIIAGGSVNLVPFFALGILSESRIYAGNLKQSFIFSGNFYAGRILSASISYTLANSSFDNLGLGLAVKAGPAQIYLIADKIPLSWDRIYVQDQGTTGYNGVSLPSNFSMLSLQAGVNITFGNPVSKKTDKPMLLEEKKD